MFYIYILQSLASGRYYIGSSDDVEQRLMRHNGGKVRSTKAFMPWKVVYKEAFQSRAEALKREHQLKSWKKRESLEELIQKHF